MSKYRDNKKSKWDSIKPLPFKEKYSYTRFKDGQIVPNGFKSLVLDDFTRKFAWVEEHPPRQRMEYWPNDKSFKPKMTRGGL